MVLSASVDVGGRTSVVGGTVRGGNVSQVRIGGSLNQVLVVCGSGTVVTTGCVTVGVTVAVGGGRVLVLGTGSGSVDGVGSVESIVGAEVAVVGADVELEVGAGLGRGAWVVDGGTVSNWAAGPPLDRRAAGAEVASGLAGSSASTACNVSAVATVSTVSSMAGIDVPARTLPSTSEPWRLYAAKVTAATAIKLATVRRDCRSRFPSPNLATIRRMRSIAGNWPIT